METRVLEEHELLESYGPGFRMLQAMGYKAGQRLGAGSDGPVVPVMQLRDVRCFCLAPRLAASTGKTEFRTGETTPSRSRSRSRQDRAPRPDMAVECVVRWGPADTRQPEEPRRGLSLDVEASRRMITSQVGCSSQGPSEASLEAGDSPVSSRSPAPGSPAEASWPPSEATAPEGLGPPPEATASEIV